jgi:hypothetical protein
MFAPNPVGVFGLNQTVQVASNLAPSSYPTQTRPVFGEHFFGSVNANTLFSVCMTLGAIVNGAKGVGGAYVFSTN